MGANAAVKAYGQVGRLEELLAIELIHASEALRYREAEPGRQLQRELEAFRAAVPPLQGDENLHDKLAAARAFLRNRPAPVESLPAL
jgi:histidine ammonia-lyase